VSSTGIKELDATTRFRQMVTGESTAGEGFAKPFDVVVCRGRIFVSDTVKRTVLVFDIPGRRFFEIGGKEPGTLRKPIGLAADTLCNLFVADATTMRVMRYDKDGKFLGAVGGIQSKLFERLSHVAVTPDGTRLFAVDTGGVESSEHRVRVFDVPTGQHLYDIGTRGDAPGKLNLPRDVEIGPDGLLYIVDGGNFRVQAFRQDGTFVRTFGSIGRQFGQFSRPKGIASDPSGNLYVSDAYFANFQIFSPEGDLLLFIGDRGAGPGPAKFMLPAGIDVDEDGRVYVVDQFFRKVDIFRPADLPKEGGHLGAWYQITAPQ
jgi:DNA-binding beta-propeller fold protein YncE